MAELYLEMQHPLAAALAALMRSETLDRPEQKLLCLKKIRHAELDDARRFILKTVVDTYLDLQGSEAARFAAELARETNQEVREMVITWEEALAARGAEGEARGEARGELRGKIEGLRVALRSLLRHRFGLGSRDAESRLETIADPARLEQLLERAIEARSLDELGLAS